MYIPVIVAGHILPSFEPQVGEISSRRKRDTKRKMRGWGTGEREGGGKVQQIPATPDPCLSWAWLWWKAWDKNLKRKPFIGRHCSVSLSKGCFTLYISLCVCGMWTKGRFGHDTSLFPAWCSSKRVKPGDLPAGIHHSYWKSTVRAHSAHSLRLFIFITVDVSWNSRGAVRRCRWCLFNTEQGYNVWLASPGLR